MLCLVGRLILLVWDVDVVDGNNVEKFIVGLG